LLLQIGDGEKAAIASGVLRHSGSAIRPPSRTRSCSSTGFTGAQ
jgi:hypothetical protein